MLWKKYNLLVVFIFVFILSIVFHAFYGIYRVKSESMIPTLNVGDYVLVKKRKSFGKDTEQNIKKVEKGKIYVLEMLVMKSNLKFFVDQENSLYIKRCIGEPSDTIEFNRQYLKINSKFEKAYSKYFDNKEKNSSGYKRYIVDNHYYPHDSSFNWDADNYGPLYIPKKNTNIQLTDKLRILYNDIILYETNKNSINSSKAVSSYTFKKNYYYFVGDNLYNSTDSRHWGFIPKENIIGEAKYILWSKSRNIFLNKL